MADEITNTQETPVTTTQETTAAVTPEPSPSASAPTPANDPWATFTKSLQDSGYTPEQVANALRAKAQPEVQEEPVETPAGQTPDIRALVRSEIEAATKNAAVRIAESEHVEKAKVADVTTKALIDDKLKGIDPAFADLTRLAIEKAVNDARTQSLYPEGHPLADKYFRPLSREQVEAAVNSVITKAQQARAATLGSVGRAAYRVPPTVGGNGTNNGGGSKPVLGRTQYDERDLAVARQALAQSPQF